MDLKNSPLFQPDILSYIDDVVEAVADRGRTSVVAAREAILSLGGDPITECFRQKQTAAEAAKIILDNVAKVRRRDR